MIQWLQQNVFTILIIAALIVFFGWLVYTLIRDRKRGKSSCCGGCAGCALAGKCHPPANTDAAKTRAETERTDTAPKESDPI